MGSKHLKQLLDEDQEPFVLQNYIDERRLQLLRKPKSHSQHVRKRKPISDNSGFPISLCKNACFSPLQAFPEITKSPLFYFSSSSSQPQSPFRAKTNANTDTLFIHVPSRTAALLLEAALRIQRQSAAQKQKSHKGRLGFAILGSILSKLGHRKKTRKREIIMEDRRVRVPVKDKQRCDHYSTDVIREPITERTTITCSEECKRVVDDPGLSCSRKIEERFPDFDTSTSCRDGDCEETETELAFEEVENEGFGSSSPFRFALMNNPSEIFRSPELESPATSPKCRRKQGVQNEEVLQEGHVLAKGYDEEEKEHSSPVSVLDNPQFEDDDDDEGGSEVHESENEDNDVGFELERSFAIVQRTKHRLLQKLRRFEQLAELDPVELEKRILEDEDEYEDGEYGTDADDSSCSSAEDNSTVFAREVLTCSSPFDCQRVSLDVKKLVLDLGEGAERALGFEGKGLLTKKLRGRLGSWKGAKMKTIDLMVELDLRREGQEWRKNHEEDLQDISALIELGIFEFLVEELSEELVHDSTTCS